MNTETLKIKYHSNEIDKLRYIDGKSDWIDLRSAEHIVLKKDDFKLINLGISISLPDGYEAIVAPRSSTFKNFGVIQTNSIGIIDELYGKNNTNDIWKWPCLAMRDTEININDRICQFRIIKHQPILVFEEVTSLPGDNNGEERGGFGSTGIK